MFLIALSFYFILFYNKRLTRRFSARRCGGARWGLYLYIDVRRIPEDCERQGEVGEHRVHLDESLDDRHYILHRPKSYLREKTQIEEKLTSLACGNNLKLITNVNNRQLPAFATIHSVAFDILRFDDRNN
jgi:hypothetical protein